MPLIPQITGGAPSRKRSVSDAHRRGNEFLNAYVPMQNYNSPQFVPLPISPNPGYLPAFTPYPVAWPSPHFYPMDLQPVPTDPRAASVHLLLAPHLMNAMQPYIHWDVRFKPEHAVVMHPRSHYVATKPMDLPEEAAGQHATNPPMQKMKLICRELPWRISVNNAKGVTVRDILEAVYKELQAPLTEGEWWIAQDEERERTLAAYKANCSGDFPETKRKLDEGVKRVDWLARKTVLAGISRGPLDEPFIKARVMDPKAQVETWVLELGELME